MTTRNAAAAPGHFCEQAWSSTAALQERIVSHPFNEALAAGTLDQTRFAYYLVQDSRYLRQFSAALNTAARRAADDAEAAFFSRGAQRALTVEGSLHSGYLARLLPFDSAAAMATSDACRAYTAFLSRAAAERPYPVLVASLLPCFWVYQHVGQRILARTASQPTHPYREWIDTYSDPSFAAAVGEIRAIADRRATADPVHARTMLDAFGEATGHEWAFWDAAWNWAPG